MFKFIVCALITSLFTVSLAAPARTLVVWSPHIFYPSSNVHWKAGEKHNVTWDTAHIPPQAANQTGTVMLGHAGHNSENLDIEHPLATNFPLQRGWVTCHIPWNLPPRNDYFVVLFGDSGNVSQKFAITRR